MKKLLSITAVLSVLFFSYSCSEEDNPFGGESFFKTGSYEWDFDIVYNWVATSLIDTSCYDLASDTTYTYSVGDIVSEENDQTADDNTQAVLNADGTGFWEGVFLTGGAINFTWDEYGITFSGVTIGGRSYEGDIWFDGTNIQCQYEVAYEGSSYDILCLAGGFLPAPAFHTYTCFGSAPPS